jgi:hypothetical protein
MSKNIPRAQSERETQWLNRYSDVVSANVRLGKAMIGFSTLNDIIFGIEASSRSISRQDSHWETT